MRVSSCFFLLIILLTMEGAAQPFLRLNQVGYLPGETKVALAFSDSVLPGAFEVWRVGEEEAAFQGGIRKAPRPGWGKYAYYYEMDFTALQDTGRYELRVGAVRSGSFTIGEQAYRGVPKDLLVFMQQQRCGYNPFLDMVCHQRDGRSFYGSMPDSTFVDVSGGWHDAGDQLKYLITGSFATASMLLAYERYPEVFEDRVNGLGQGFPNGIPDVLDEARWGLEWIHKCHVLPNQLVHQVADDRDHLGWKWPDQDNSDYGWGPNSYRAAYFASGAPQGLHLYQSKATGVANLAGRSAAAMAMAYRIWREDLKDTLFAGRCLEAAKSLYAMGQAREGYQQGNSYGAPYRYNEDTWADDMEWAAAELYAATGRAAYLEAAKRYARLAGTTSWMPLDTADHYRFYPFVNIGHYALARQVEGPFRDTLLQYYRRGIEACLSRGRNNSYQVGVPFIWCSNNLVTALMTQIILFEELTGDTRYHDFLLAQRDWLLGRNPWGTSMFTGIPRDGEYPEAVHTSVYALTGEMVPGGLVDGPVYHTIFQSLKGLTLTEPDEFADFQNDYVVYHDDIGDYSTNEPTMDGTAGAILVMAYFAH
jgi:endoglucanase